MEVERKAEVPGSQGDKAQNLLTVPHVPMGESCESRLFNLTIAGNVCTFINPDHTVFKSPPPLVYYSISTTPIRQYSNLFINEALWRTVVLKDTTRLDS